MNTKDYGHHCSGYQRPDGEPTRYETWAVCLSVVGLVLGVLTLLFQPYAGIWSVFGGFMCCSPVALCFALDVG